MVGRCPRTYGFRINSRTKKLFQDKGHDKNMMNNCVDRLDDGW